MDEIVDRQIAELLDQPPVIAQLPEVAALIHADVLAGRMSAEGVRAILYYLVMLALESV